MKKFSITVTKFILCIALLGGCKQSNMDDSLSLSINPVTTAIPAKRLALRFDDYENLSISEYRTKVFKEMEQNESEYLSLIECVNTNSELKDIKYTNENAYFIVNILIPIIAEKYNTWRFNNSRTGDYYSVEYSISYTILNADKITMGKRNKAINAVMDGIQELLDSRTAEQLSDEAGTQAALDIIIKELAEKYTTDSFQVEAELLYRTNVDVSPVITSEQATLEERGILVQKKIISGYFP